MEYFRPCVTALASPALTHSRPCWHPSSSSSSTPSSLTPGRRTSWSRADNDTEGSVSGIGYRWKPPILPRQRAPITKRTLWHHGVREPHRAALERTLKEERAKERRLEERGGQTEWGVVSRAGQTWPPHLFGPLSPFLAASSSGAVRRRCCRPGLHRRADGIAGLVSAVPLSFSSALQRDSVFLHPHPVLVYPARCYPRVSPSSPSSSTSRSAPTMPC